MAKELKDIQHLINEKAENRLKNEIDGIARHLWNGNAYELCRSVMVNAGTCEKPHMIQLSAVFNSEGFYHAVFDANIERYKAKETQDFLDRVESLKQDVDNLMSMNQDY